MPMLRIRRRALALVFSLSALAATAQPVNTTQFTVPGTGTGGPSAELFSTPGGWVAAGSLLFRNDSNCVSLVRFSPQLTITRSRQYRLASHSRTNYSALVPVSNGGLVGTARNCLYRYDSAFAVQWGAQITTSGIGVDVLTTHGPGRVVAYPFNPVLTSSNGFTRVWLNAATGTGWRGRRLSSTLSQWRIISVYAPDATGIHYLTGDNGAPFIKLDTTKVYWSYLLNAGGIYTRVGAATGTANGQLLVPMSDFSATGQPQYAILCRYDTAGTLLWGRQFALSGRNVGFSDVHELPTGELLLAGYARQGSGKYQPMIFRLTTTGALVWAHRWNLGTGGPIGGVPTIVPLPGGRFRLFNSDMTFIDLDANFNGCQFVNETANITTSTPTITATPLPLTMTPLPVAGTVAPPLLNRSVTYSPTSVCTAVGVEEEATAAAAAAFTAWPQPLPRGEALRVALPTGWSAADTHLTLLSALGQVVWRGPWADAVTLPATLPPGVWTLTAESRAGRLHRRLVSL